MRVMCLHRIYCIILHYIRCYENNTQTYVMRTLNYGVRRVDLVLGLGEGGGLYYNQ